ncbi:hypothetical protein, partial [Vibrio lentus]|uniref:hypothetical protein n=1 Tax=Vibrio lentus TaxID=136468 RepID=UPI003D100892
MMLFEKIIWSVSTMEDIRFIQRFEHEFEGDIILIHTNLITYFYSKYNIKFKSYIPKFNGRYYFCKNIERSFNVLSGRLSVNEASKAYSATLDLLIELEHKKEIDKSNLYLIPSGRHIHQWAIKDYAMSKGARKLFINYANFPGYSIFDPSGTDRNSSIYGDSDILNKIKEECYSNKEIAEIFERFLRLKRKQLTIPQK